MQVNRARQSRSQAAGYTLTELTVAMAVVGLVAVMAFTTYLGRRRYDWLQKAALELTSELRAARMRAVSEATTVFVAFDSEHRQCRFWCDLNTNGTMESDEIEVRDLGDIPDLNMHVTATNGAFLPSGAFSASNGYCQIRLWRGHAGSKVVRILPHGQVDWLDGSP